MGTTKEGVADLKALALCRATSFPPIFVLELNHFLLISCGANGDFSIVFGNGGRSFRVLIESPSSSTSSS